MNSPTIKQVRYLKKVKVKPLKSKQACSALINYLINGSIFEGADRKQTVGVHIARYKNKIKYVMGKQCYNRNDEGITGIITNLRPKSLHECIAQLQMEKISDVAPEHHSPWMVSVKWDKDGKKTFLSFGLVELVGLQEANKQNTTSINK